MLVVFECFFLFQSIQKLSIIPTGELLAPQRGQGMGVERAVALSSKSRALKTWPQLGQRNNVVPLSMVVLLLFF